MSTERRPLYEYCLPHLTEARRLLAEILEKQSKLYTFWPQGSKFYAYAKFLLDRAAAETDAVGSARRDALLNFLDYRAGAGLFSSFFDASARANLTAQVYWIYLALGGQVPGVEAYDSDEMTKIAAGDFGYYTDEVMMYTMADLWEKGSDQFEISALFKILTPIVEDYRPWDNMDRASALIETLALHNLWSAWFGLSDAQRGLLLRHYFFASIVAGVPVLEWLKIYDKNASANEKVLEKITEEVANNQESIPSFGENQNIKFIDILKRYAAASGGMAGGFEQEKFLDDLYRGDKRKGPHSQWLRQAFSALRFLGGEK